MFKARWLTTAAVVGACAWGASTAVAAGNCESSIVSETTASPVFGKTSDVDASGGVGGAAVASEMARAI